MSRYRRFALAGLQTGISGTLAMLIWLAIASVWSRRSVWWIPNLVASAFYGDVSMRYGSGFYTIVGLAMIVFLYGLVGLFFGLFLREHPGGFRLFCFALLVALAVNWALLRWFWRGANPIAHLYAPDTQILLGNWLYGCFLARYPATLRSLAKTPPNSGYTDNK
jgi:hypothetical protein